MRNARKNVVVARIDGGEVTLNAAKWVILIGAGAATFFLANLYLGVSHAVWAMGVWQLKRALFN